MKPCNSEAAQAIALSIDSPPCVHLATLNKTMERFVGLGNFEFLFKRETF